MILSLKQTKTLFYLAWTLFIIGCILFVVGCGETSKSTEQINNEVTAEPKFTQEDLGHVDRTDGFEAFRLYKITIDSTTYIIANKRYDGGITVLDKIKNK